MDEENFYKIVDKNQEERFIPKFLSKSEIYDKIKNYLKFGISNFYNFDSEVLRELKNYKNYPSKPDYIENLLIEKYYSGMSPNGYLVNSNDFGNIMSDYLQLFGFDYNPEILQKTKMLYDFFGDRWNFFEKKYSRKNSRHHFFSVNCLYYLKGNKYILFIEKKKENDFLDYVNGQIIKYNFVKFENIDILKDLKIKDYEKFNEKYSCFEFDI